MAARYREPCALLEAAGLDQERRSLRLSVRELGVQLESGAVLLEFRLARGAFATAVLRELFTLADYEESST